MSCFECLMIFRIDIWLWSHQNPPEPTRTHQNPSESTKTHQNPPEPIRTHQNPPEPIRTHQNPLESTRTHQNPPESIRTHGTPSKAAQTGSISVKMWFWWKRSMWRERFVGKYSSCWIGAARKMCAIKLTLLSAVKYGLHCALLLCRFSF